MTFVLNKRVWLLAERLYIHAYDPDKSSPNKFIKLLALHDIDYPGENYSNFGSIKGLYTFMSDDDYTFASFMEMIPSYKYLPVLKEIVFDEKIKRTAQDSWNYYGEGIRNWYPELKDLLKLAGVQIDKKTQQLTFPEIEYPFDKKDFLSDSFSDIFLDYIRKEINECYQNGLYLSVMFLSRKILEVIVVRIFEVVFPKLKNKTYSPENHSLWFDTKSNKHHSFDTLLDNLSEHAKDFHEDKDLILEFVSLVRPFKNESNKHVHFDYKTPDEQYINQWKIPIVIGLAKRLFRKYCNP
jgi:hypothetical protein